MVLLGSTAESVPRCIRGGPSICFVEDGFCADTGVDFLDRLSSISCFYYDPDLCYFDESAPETKINTPTLDYGDLFDYPLSTVSLLSTVYYLLESMRYSDVIC